MEIVKDESLLLRCWLQVKTHISFTLLMRQWNAFNTFYDLCSFVISKYLLIQREYYLFGYRYQLILGGEKRCVCAFIFPFNHLTLGSLTEHPFFLIFSFKLSYSISLWGMISVSDLLTLIFFLRFNFFEQFYVHRKIEVWDFPCTLGHTHAYSLTLSNPPQEWYNCFKWWAYIDVS